MKMCPSHLFFTEHPERRRGGIIVCGLNWGAKPPKYPEKHDETCQSGWNPALFYQDDDPLRKALTKWMTVWGHDPRTDKEFDSALLVTNLFYNTTHGSGRLQANRQEWDCAIQRLMKGAAEVDASGVLIATRLAFSPLDNVLRKADSNVRWNDAGGNWQTSRCGDTEIAIGPHYRARNGMANGDSVLAAKRNMSAWLDRAIGRSRSLHRT